MLLLVIFVFNNVCKSSNNDVVVTRRVPSIETIRNNFQHNTTTNTSQQQLLYLNTAAILPRVRSLSSSCSVPDLSALSANVWRVYSFSRLLSGPESRDNFDKFDNATIWCLVFLLYSLAK